MDNCRQNVDKAPISPSTSSSAESATGQTQEDADEEEQEVEDHNANDKTLLSSTSSPQLDSHNNYNRSRLMVVPYQPDLRIIRHVMHMSPSCLLNYLFSLETRLCTIRQERKDLESENAKLRTFFKLQYNRRSNPNQNQNPRERGKENSNFPANNNDNCTIRETANANASKSGEKRTIISTCTAEVQTEIPYEVQTRTHEIETMTDTEDLSQNNISNRANSVTVPMEESEDRKESFVSVLAPPLKMKESKKSLGKSRHHSHRSSTAIIPNIRASAIVPTHALPEPFQEAQNLIRTIRSPTFFPEDTSTAVLRNNNGSDIDNNEGNNEEDQQEPHSSNVHSISISNTNLRSVSNPEIHSSLSSQNLSVNAQPEISTISTTSTLVAPTTTATATIVPKQSDSKPETLNGSSGSGTGTSDNPGSKNEPKIKRREFQDRIEHLIRRSSAILCQNQNQHQNPNPNQIHTHNEDDTDDHTSAAASSSIFGPLSITGVCSSSRSGAQSSSSWSDYTDFSRTRRGRRQNHLDHENYYNNDSSSSSTELLIPGFENFPTFDQQERPHSLSSIRTQLQFNVQLLQVHRRQLAAGNLIEELEEENEQGMDDENGNENEHEDLEINLDPDEEILRPLLGQRNLSNANGQSTNRSQIQSNDSLHVNVDSISSSSSSTEEGRDRGDAGASSPSSSSDSETQSDSDVSSVHSLFHPSETQSTTLCGKYGNLTAYSRPRPASGHRYVISELLTRKNESKLPSWVPSYAQKIECILTRYLDEAQANSNTVKSNNDKDDDDESQVASGSKSTSRKIPSNITSKSAQQHQQEEQQVDEDEQRNNKPESGSGTGIPLDLVYVRLNRSPPPLTLLEFDESSEESCIRSISSTKRRKSCLRISRDAKSFGESRPKNLSFSQHVYIADEESDSKTRSCPGIYYMGEFSIQAGVPHLHAAELKRIGILKRRKYKRVRKMVMKVFHCFRCNSNSNVLQASHIFIPSHGKKKILSASQSTTHIPILVDALSSHCQCPQSNFNVSVAKKASSIIRPHRKKSNPSCIKKTKSTNNNNHCNEHDRKS